MTTISEIKDRLNAVAFAGRSYAGADRAAVAKAYSDAVTAFDQNAAVDMAYLLDRIEELQKAITVDAENEATAIEAITHKACARTVVEFTRARGYTPAELAEVGVCVVEEALR